MNIPPPPPPIGMDIFENHTQFLDPEDPESGVQIGDEILRHGNCFQMPNDPNIYKAIFHYSMPFGPNYDYYRFGGITRQTYVNGEWGNNERIYAVGFAQAMSGLKIVPCPVLNRNKARNVYPVLQTLNQVSRQGFMPHLSATIPATNTQPARHIEVPANLQGSIESYLTGIEGRPQETRARMRELLSRPPPSFYNNSIQPGVGGKKAKRKTRGKYRRSKTQRKRR